MNKYGVLADGGREGCHGLNQRDEASEAHGRLREQLGKKLDFGNTRFWVEAVSRCPRPCLWQVAVWAWCLGESWQLVGDVRVGVGEIVQGEDGDLGGGQGLGLEDFSLLGCVCKSRGAWKTGSHERDQSQARREPRGGGR